MQEFTQQQLRYLSESKKTYIELGKEFNLSPDNMRYVFRKYKIKKLSILNNSIDQISEDQIQFLKDNFEENSLTFFQKEFNTTEKVIRNLCNKLGLSKKDKPRIVSFKSERAYSDSDIEYIKNNFLNKSISEFSDILKRSEASIKKKLWELKLPYLINGSDNWSESELGI